VKGLAGRTKRCTLGVLAFALIAAAIWATSAVATSSATGKINACVDKRTGVIRIHKHGRCFKRERKLTWNAAGTRGAAGVPGSRGPTGAQGAAGAAGVPGARGPTGAAGAKGDKGDKGTTGAKGDQGDKGDPGAKGDKGEKGDKGDQGETGPTGGRGPTGVRGVTGATGPAGPTGSTGPAGASFVLGNSGHKNLRTGYFVGTSTVSPVERVVAQVVPLSLAVNSLYVVYSGNVPGGKSLTFTLRVDGTDSALACTMTGTNVCNAALASPVSVSAGQSIDLGESGTIAGSGNPSIGMLSWAIGP
jgi:hypothetical protein